MPAQDLGATGPSLGDEQAGGGHATRIIRRDDVVGGVGGVEETGFGRGLRIGLREGSRRKVRGGQREILLKLYGAFEL